MATDKETPILNSGLGCGLSTAASGKASGATLRCFIFNMMTCYVRAGGKRAICVAVVAHSITVS